MDRDLINKILNETETGYDLMAEKFSETRKFFWRDLEFIGDYAKDGDKVLDYGCGNGRLLELLARKNINYTGVDVSQKLVDIAKNKYKPENIKFYRINASQSSLAFENDYFNTVYSIAVLHHIPGEELRKEIVKEIYRVTKPGGYIVITVWNLWQKRYIKNILKNWLNKIIGESKLDWNDCYVTFKNNQGKVFNRYHHVFTKNELKSLFSRAGFMIERCDIIESRNILLIGKK